jgi:hypothetical protein
LMDLMKMGFIDPHKGLEVMDMGGINKIYDQLQVDQRQAQRENLRMSKVTDADMQQYQMANPPSIDPTTGQPSDLPLIVPNNTWDNHKLHIEYHNQFRKGQAFENLPQVSKVLFEQHVQGHLQAMAEEMYTMNPQVIAADKGLPPLPPGMPGEGGGEQQPSNPIDNTISKGNAPPPGSMQPGDMQQPGQGNPGPNPMPDLAIGGMQ